MALLGVGVPFDVAFSLDAVMRRAMLIANGLVQGGEFDWNSWSWRRQE